MREYDYIKHKKNEVEAIKEKDGEDEVVDSIPNHEYYNGVFEQE